MKWIRVPDGGWLRGQSGYESEDGRFFVARDYVDEDYGPLTMWMLHGPNGFIDAFDTLRDAKSYVS
jgi:hypothetical protein